MCCIAIALSISRKRNAKPNDLITILLLVTVAALLVVGHRVYLPLVMEDSHTHRR